MRSRVVIRKSQPNGSEMHVNRPLTNISIANIQDPSLYVADQVFPVMPVQNKSDLYYIWDRSDFLRDEAQDRAPGTESAGGGMKLSTNSYNCRVKAFHKDIADQDRDNADSELQLDRAATMLVTQKMRIRLEKQWVAGYFKTGVWAVDTTPSILWSAGATAIPRENVDAQKATIEAGSGLSVNTMVMGKRVFYALRSCPQVLEQFKYTSAESIDTAMLAQFFGVERLLVMGAVSDSGAEGGTASYDFIGGKHVWMGHVASTPSLMTPSAGYQFGWSGFLGSQNTGIRIKKFRRAEEFASDRIEGEMARDMKVVCSYLGCFFNGAVA